MCFGESCAQLFSVTHDRGDWNERRSYTNDGYRRETDNPSTVHLSQIYLVTPSAANLNIASCRERAFPADARQALAKSGKGTLPEAGIYFDMYVCMYECVRARALDWVVGGRAYDHCSMYVLLNAD